MPAEIEAAFAETRGALTAFCAKKPQELTPADCDEADRPILALQHRLWVLTDFRQEAAELARELRESGQVISVAGRPRLTLR